MRRTAPDLAGGFLDLEELPDPEVIDPFDVVVRVAAAGVCRTDLHIVEGRLETTLPLILGHENAGSVAALGSKVRTVEIGDTVLCYPFLADGLSSAERRGLDSAAPGRTTPGIDAPGGYAEFVRVTERAIVPLPDFADPTALATLTDAGLAAYRACTKAARQLVPGTAALVIGAGGLGHIAIQILKAITSAAVIAVDVRAEACELARAVGADIACSPQELAGLRLDNVAAAIDFVGSAASAESAAGALGFGGHYLIVGVDGDITIPTLDLVAGEMKVEGVYVGTYPELVEVTELALSGAVQPVVATYPLDHAEDALRDLAGGRVTGRAVLVP